VKNLLLFLPALLNRSLGHAWGPLLAAFFAFSFVASGPYVLNDLFDIEADRLHPTKRRRPFASVVLSILAGLVTALILVVTGFAFCTPAGAQLTLSLLVYAVVSVTYSGFLKNKPVLDVVVLAFMYTWRVYVGGWFPKHGFRPG
jgi:4-hydroxybenzoate polyprenyltransferase